MRWREKRARQTEQGRRDRKQSMGGSETVAGTKEDNDN